MTLLLAALAFAGCTTTTAPENDIIAGELSIAPSAKVVGVGHKLQLRAVARSADGEVMSGYQISWSSSSEDIASISDAGVVTAVSMGRASITAQAEKLNGRGREDAPGILKKAVEITVDTMQVASVEVQPGVANIEVGGSMDFDAVVKDARGGVLADRYVQWSVSNSNVASVNDAGVVEGLALGSVTTTATVEGQSGSADLTVGSESSPPPVASVTVSPGSATLEVGQTVQLTAVLKDADGNGLSGRDVSWTTGNGNIASVDASGRVAGEGPGSTTITASSEGKSGSATITVPDNTPPPSGSAFYVDINASNASDSNPGTEASPWKTIRKAVQTLTAGQTAYVKNGTYNESAGCSWTTPALNPSNSGQPGAPISFRAYPGHKPIVTNSVTSDPCPVIGTRYKSYIIWDGFEVKIPGERAVAIFDSDHITFENSEVHGPTGPGSNNTDGVRVEASDSITLRNLLIYDVYNANNTHNASGVKLYHSSRVLVEHSEIFDCVSGIFDKRDGTDNVFAYNYVHDNKYGIELSTTDGYTARGQTAHHNVTARNSSVGIVVAGSSGSPNRDAKVYSNTSVDEQNRSIYVETDINGQADVWNNIAANGGHNLTGSNAVVRVCDHNLFHNTSTGCGISGNPMFVGGSGAEAYRLQSGSPAMGAGRNGETVGAFQTGNEVIGRRGS